MSRSKVAILFAAIISWSAASTVAEAAFLFAADWGAGTITRYAPNGSSTVFASGLSEPAGMAFDAHGNLFVADEGDGTVSKLSPAGVRTTFATGAGQPYGLAIDPNGNIFVSDLADNRRIYKYTPTGSRSLFATGSPTFISPEGLAIDANGNLFVADFNRVDKFTPTGVESTFFNSPFGAVGLAFAPSGNLFLTDGQSEVYQITPSGVGTLFGTIPISGGTAPSSSSVAVDPDGDVFVGDHFHGIIYKFTPAGIRSVFAAGVQDAQGGMVFATLPEPSSLALAAIGGLALAAFFRKRSRAAAEPSR